MTCKVDRVRSEYGLEGLDDRLERRYTRDDETGLRDLEQYLNTWILREAMVTAGMTPLDGEIENYYRLLTGDDVSPPARNEARRELAQAGLDVDELLASFVSYQTVRKHLNECLGVDTSRPTYQPSPEDDRRQIDRLCARVERVVTTTLERLQRHDALAIGDLSVSVAVKVRCGSCGRSHHVQTFLDRGSCPCKVSTAENAA